jgi:secondary thiamine-phosphate synthase enzyme
LFFSIRGKEAESMEILEIETGGHSELRDVTEAVNGAVRKSGAKEGVCLVFIPHTTCAVTLNENWDPDVQKDIENFLNRAVPWENGYRHQEGNSAAHIKTLLTGSSVSVPIHGGRLFLGEWQGVYLAEYDGPRKRKMTICCLPCS